MPSSIFNCRCGNRKQTCFSQHAAQGFWKYKQVGIFWSFTCVSSTQNATKSGSKIHYVDFTIHKKRLRLELEETFAQSRSRVKMRKRRERDILLWCTSHTKLWQDKSGETILRCPFKMDLAIFISVTETMSWHPHDSVGFLRRWREQQLYSLRGPVTLP